MSTIHTVELPDGQIAMRVSKGRVYEWAVGLGPVPRSYLQRLAEDDLERHQQSLARYQAVIARLEAGEPVRTETATSRFGSDRHYLGDREVTLGWEHRDAAVPAAGILATYRDFVADIERAAARVEARLNDILAGDELQGGWGVATWCSRRDLAEKAARQYGDRGEEVRIFETTRVTK